MALNSERRRSFTVAAMVTLPLRSDRIPLTRRCESSQRTLDSGDSDHNRKAHTVTPV